MNIFFLLSCFFTNIICGCVDNYVIESESSDFWQGKIIIPISENVDGWSVNVGFDNDVDNIDSALATATGSGKMISKNSNMSKSEEHRNVCRFPTIFLFTEPGVASLA